MSAPCRLYLITPASIDDLQGFAGAFDAALGAGDIACVQLRLKGEAGAPASDDEIITVAAALLPIAKNYGAAFVINDRPDLALKAGVDGVHLGQSDASYVSARRILGDDAMVGVTCHASKDLALEASEAGADYVAFGAFYPTQTKATTARPEPELLEWWRHATIVPSVAIGGVTPENCAPLVAAGADFLAVSAAIWNDAEGPAAAVTRFEKTIRAAQNLTPGKFKDG